MKTKLSIVLLLLMSFFLSCKENPKSDEINIISIEEFREAINNENSIQLVDVRTLEEYQAGHLKNAKNICVTEDDFQEKAQQLNKNEPIYLYCRSGKRSARAAEILKEMGFTEIYDMDGGFINWQENQYEYIE